MFTVKHLINIISLLLIGIISALFIIKYFSRGTEFYLQIVMLYFIILSSFIYLIDSQIDAFKKFEGKKAAIIYTLIFSILLIILYQFIPEKTRVGRFVAINQWLDLFINEVYPYSAKSHPSGFPFLFFIASPFYFMGDSGYMIVFGIFLFLFTAIQRFETSKQAYVVLILFLSSIPIYFEYLVRSELFTNVTLFIVFVLLIDKFKNSLHLKRVFLFLSLLLGILLSTRLIIALYSIPVLLFFFRNDFKLIFKFSFVSIFVFILTLIPFYFWNVNSFLTDGPLAIQSLYLPVWAMVFLIIISFYGGYIVADLQELFFFLGLISFSAVSISFILSITEFGIQKALFDSSFDISYFIFSVPFFLLSIKEYKVDRFLGKIYASVDDSD